MTHQNAQNATTTIAIAKDYLHFSAAHFTIFSASERENLHGHNFQVRCEIEADPGDEGLCFDYTLLKTCLRELCQTLDERTLMPGNSAHLQIETDGDYQVALFADERIPFLPRDLLVLPLNNITIEALSQWFLDKLLHNEEILKLPLLRLSVGIASGPNQWADRHWVKT